VPVVGGFADRSENLGGVELRRSRAGTGERI
jgi:hypothetical protein